MSTKESLLLEKTFNDADGTMRRVYYTLTQPDHLKPIDRSLPAAHATASRTAMIEKHYGHLVQGAARDKLAQVQFL